MNTADQDINPRLSQWQMIFELTQAMRKRVGEGDWEAVAELHARREKSIEAFFADPIPDEQVDLVSKGIAKEARRLGIPVIAIIDSNSDPDLVDYPVPGNDDAARALELYCSLISRAAIDGISRSSAGRGADLGASETAPAEEAIQAAE